MMEERVERDDAVNLGGVDPDSSATTCIAKSETDA